jgi:head-tail adaptor
MEEIIIKTPDKKEIKVSEKDMQNQEIEIWFMGRKYTIKITARSRVLVMN